MSRQLRRRLEAVWQHASPIGGQPSATSHRYVPKTTGEGGGGWLVFDRKTKTYLDGRETLAIPYDILRDETYCDA